MAVRDRIWREAVKWPPLIGPAPKGVDYLLDMYQQAAPTLFPSAPAPWSEAIKQAVRSVHAQGKWISKKATKKIEGTIVPPDGIHWCGIFATWILQKAGLNVV